MADRHLDTLAPLIAQADRWLAAAIEAADVPENLREAARHAVLVGGKRLRPILAMLACEACGGPREQARPAAVAIELIHAFSLVHDDLPALDNDLLRRGQPTVHARYGEAMAILAGDLLMSMAFEVASESAAPGGLAADLAQATTRMINGQVLDTLGGFGQAQREPVERLHAIHANKTGALIVAACTMGARCAGADVGQRRIIARYGDAVGLMFQIVDDLLDVTQSTEHLGKASGKDESAGKLTFPGVLGIDASGQRVEALRREATEVLRPLGRAAQGLAELADYLAVRTR